MATNGQLAKDLRKLRDDLAKHYGWLISRYEDDPRSVTGILSEAADRLESRERGVLHGAASEDDLAFKEILRASRG